MQKNKFKILLFQEQMQLSYIISNLLLRGYSGLIQNAVGFVRNIVIMRNVDSKLINYGLIILALGLGIGFNNLGILGLLPVFGGLQASLVMLKEQDVRKIKVSIILNLLTYVVYSFALMNYVAVITNLVSVFATLGSLLKSGDRFHPTHPQNTP